MLQKVIKIGSSVGITIPKKSAEELGLSAGDSVEFAVSQRERRITIEPVITSVNTEILEWARGFVKKYRPALEALAKK